MYLIYTIFAITFVIVTIFFKDLKHFLRVCYLARQFPGPKPWPLLGNANLFLGAKPENVFKIVCDIMNDYGKTVKFWLGLEFSIFMLDIKDVEHVLGTNNLLVKSIEYNFLNNWLCEGLLISKPAKWYKRRKILTPAFHFKILEQFVEVFDHNSCIIVNNLRKATENKSGLISMDHWVNLVTLDVICGKF